MAVGIGTVVAAFELYDLVHKMNEKSKIVQFLSDLAVKLEKSLQCYPGLVESDKALQQEPV